MGQRPMPWPGHNGRAGMAGGRSERRTAVPGGSPAESGLRLPEAGAALRDLWSVYDGQYDEISAATMERIVAEGGTLAEIIRSYQGSADVPEVGRRQLEAGMLDGPWAPYIETVRTMGGLYAPEGLE